MAITDEQIRTLRKHLDEVRSDDVVQALEAALSDLAKLRSALLAVPGALDDGASWCECTDYMETGIAKATGVEVAPEYRPGGRDRLERLIAELTGA